MNLPFLEKSLASLTYQRNIFAGLALLQVLVVLVLGGLLYLKQERIIIVPPVVDKEFWIDANAVSDTYLEQFGLFLGQAILGKSAQSAASQRSVILRHTDPSYSGQLRQRLLEEEEVLKKQNASYAFFPLNISVDRGQSSVTITGDRLTYVSGKTVHSNKESYILRFAYSGGRLLLRSIEEVKS